MNIPSITAEDIEELVDELGLHPAQKIITLIHALQEQEEADEEEGEDPEQYESDLGDGEEDTSDE